MRWTGVACAQSAACHVLLRMRVKRCVKKLQQTEAIRDMSCRVLRLHCRTIGDVDPASEVLGVSEEHTKQSRCRNCSLSLISEQRTRANMLD